MGILSAIGLSKLRDGLSKTRESVVGKLTRLVTIRRSVDDDFLGELEEILLGADVGVDTTTEIVEGLRERAKTERYASSDELLSLLKDEMRQHLAGNGKTGEDPFVVDGDRPQVIMVVGINGVGKTTTIGKLAHGFVRAGKSVYIGAADTFRAAANEQLEIWAQRAGATLIRQQQGSDPAAVAFDTVHSAIAHTADVVIIDTAGRLHTKINLMEELRKIRRVVEKVIPTAPHEVLLVIDASTGQNGLQQAKQFSQAVGVTGLVLTKLDGTAKGGVVLAITKTLNVPVKYVGVGEGLEDLQPFDRDAFIDAMFATGGDH
ncbi:MAG TPA: signal recognition particle-docking protein FtsY [Bacteroidota bacterium]|nr:signal recognition particle-docking protein FtsY [Bacteroidota bacterium]